MISCIQTHPCCSFHSANEVFVVLCCIICRALSSCPHQSYCLLAGKLFPGPHLYAGAAIVVLWATAASLVPAMSKGNEAARTAHITLNSLNLLLFAWQVCFSAMTQRLHHPVSLADRCMIYWRFRRGRSFNPELRWLPAHIYSLYLPTGRHQVSPIVCVLAGPHWL